MWLQWTVWSKDSILGSCCAISQLCLKPTKTWKSSLRNEDVFSYHCLFSHATSKRKQKLWTSAIHNNVGLCFCHPCACLRAFIRATQERQQHGWIPTNSTLDWICYGNTEQVAVVETVEHGWDMVTDLKKCISVQRQVAPREQETNLQESQKNAPFHICAVQTLLAFGRWCCMCQICAKYLK